MKAKHYSFKINHKF